ncbi:hypothetical protein AGMMS49579_18330 [Spirochaetia bacterium]|nr:hypothetical protein AGMMS49579_18330 [Spirochaetia bacterium]
MEIKVIKLVDLLINTENYRFEPVSSQKEAIDLMIEDQNEKLYKLAEDIIIHGLNPNDAIQVSPSRHEKNKYNILEGNRRVVSLKLLNNPDLIENSKYRTLKNRFKKLIEINKNRILKEVNCIIYDDPTEADKWIKLKHTGQSDGIGTVDWDAKQIQRFDEKVEGKSSASLQVIKILEKSNLVPETVKNKIANLKITNLDRLISDPNVRDFLGIEIEKGIVQSDVDESEVIKGLTQVAMDLLRPDFRVKEIYTKEDRKDYINQFPKQSMPKLSQKAEKTWVFTSSSSRATSKQKPKQSSNPLDRKHLIPKKCILQINNPRVNAIYSELQKIDIIHANAVAVLLRVFVELSLDCFIETNKLTNVNIDSKLIKKVLEVASYLENNKLADKHICKGIKSAVNNPNDLFGTDTLNAYVHNAKFSPISNNLIITWDNIQVFIEKVWENIK